jgi:ketosteroid isomerase-like protein
MSQENVDDFLEGAEALNRGDMERFLEGYDEDVVFEPRASEMEGAFVGPDGVKEFMTGLADLYEGFRTNFSDVRDLGDRVLAIGTQTAIARGSGMEQESPLAIVATYRNGLITHFKDYGEKELALEAAGLSV